ncbi:MAG: signal peptidase I [Mediterranea sp.]|jgi:signal peptidase I|nr:signal peptidase I [Mediterranea sp.]
MKGGKWIIVLTGAVVAVLLLRGFVFTSYSIPSSGMENSLYQGDRIIVNKWSYGLRVPCMSLLSYHRWNSRPVKSGDIVVFNNPADRSQPAIDKREVFISRCIAVPGEELLLDSLYNPTASIEKVGPDRKRLYTYPKEKEQTMESLLRTLGLTKNELMGQNEQENVRNFSRYEMYLLEQATTDISWIQPQQGTSEECFRTITIPAKGKRVEIHPWNATLYRNTLVLHERIEADVKNDSLYINGEPVIACIFTKDYYWMASNNSINLADSRLFGFVPHDHIIGKASFIWFSKETSTELFNGYRWERFFRPAR